MLQSRGTIDSRQIRSLDNALSNEGIKAEIKAIEKALLQRLKQGDRIAFWELWLLHKDFLYRYCLRLTNGNVDDAQDLLSQASLLACNKLPAYDKKIDSCQALFAKLAYNYFVDKCRKQEKETRDLEHLKQTAIVNRQIEIALLQSAESQLLRQELQKSIDRAIDELSPRLREAFILRCCEDLSYSDIAETLSLSKDNARKRVQQARKFLRNRIKKYLE
ncbi:MAG: RNA polymerase sigma factor [Oscillatoria sp. SIO1A7]|nr:RNA polymerase sigma factor [Oscillatoria sp. SIO1A7]